MTGNTTRLWTPLQTGRFMLSVADRENWTIDQVAAHLGMQLDNELPIGSTPRDCWEMAMKERDRAQMDG